MTHRRAAPRRLRAACTACAAMLAACQGIDTAPGGVASVGLDPLVSPSVVIGDSLRDTLGVARPLHGAAYGETDDPLTLAVKYRALDSAVVVDSMTGVLVARSTALDSARVLVEAAGLQTSQRRVYVVPAPSVVYADSARRTLFYPLNDTSAVVSLPLTVRLFHQTSTTDSTAIPAYLVSFAIQSPSDTALARLVGDDGRNASRVDTTDANGIAGRSVRLRPLRLTSPEDSVVVLATVKYRGAPIPGSPVRLVLQVKPQP